MKTFGQKCKEAMGNKTYDITIPQPWANEVRDQTGIYPPGHIVWVYDGNIFGRPYAVDLLGWMILNMYEEGKNRATWERRM